MTKPSLFAKLPFKKLTLALLWSGIYLLTTLVYSESGLFSQFGKFGFSFFKALISWSKPEICTLGVINDLLILHLISIAFRRESKINLEEERAFQSFCAIGKLICFDFKQISKSEKTSLLLLIVKINFLPMMLGFCLGNFSMMSQNFDKLAAINFSNPSLLDFNNNLIPVVFYGLILVDTTVYSVGYAIESRRLGNVVKSVEPTILGWAAVLVCYYPLVKFSPIQLFGWQSSEFATFESQSVCAVFNIISIWLFVIYTWASVSLGFKASNLTSRGIVRKGPYAFIRHPAYTSKCLSWWVMSIPFFSQNFFKSLGCMASITIIYFLRAITEEKHLSTTDSDYQSYKKAVPYRFIPNLF